MCLVDFSFFKDFLLVLFIDYTFIYSFYIEYFLLQFLVLYILFLFSSNNNLYYSLFYLFVQVFYFGVVLSFNQVELFTGFLWVVEYIVIFVFLLMLFYINSQGDFIKNNLFIYKYSYITILLIFIFIYPTYIYYNFSFIENLYTAVYWDDYYESFNNNNMNDFVGLYISYFTFNSFEYIIIGVLLFLGSVVCINLFRLTKILKFKNYNEFLKTFRFSQSYTYSSFMRKQNLVKQANEQPAVRIFKAKICKND